MRLITLIALAAMLVPPIADAQPAPAAAVEEMVKQLEPQPRTRSMRNLVVTPVAPEAPAQPESAPARPSLSLLIQFDLNSDKVRAESLPLIENLSQALRSPQLTSARFAIEGHTDARGRADYNVKLSQRRALAVRSLLVARGIEPQRLIASGKGSTEPANPSDPQAPENRRVRIVNIE